MSDVSKFLKRVKEGVVKSDKDKLVLLAYDVIQTYKMKLTVRQIFYRLVASQKITNSEKMYHALINALSWARKAGVIDYNAIEDRTRQITKIHLHTVSPGKHLKTHYEYFRDAADYYPFSRWEGQDNRVLVLLEKQALQGIFETVCREQEVDLMVCRGYPSLTLLYDLSQRLEHEDKEIRVLYFGDYDPSGMDIERSLAESLRENFGLSFEIGRVAITRAQIDEYKIPPAPAKKSDARTAKFIEREGVAWQVELDAIEPSILTGMIASAINSYFNPEIGEESDAKHERIREAIQALTAKAIDLFDLEAAVEELDRRDFEE